MSFHPAASPALDGQQKVSIIELPYFLDCDLPCIAVGLEQMTNAVFAAHVIEGEDSSFEVKLSERVAEGKQTDKLAVNLV